MRGTRWKFAYRTSNKYGEWYVWQEESITSWPPRKYAIPTADFWRTR